VADKVRAARGLALIGGTENIDRLVAMIDDPSLPQELRLGAALSMEIVGTPRARDILLNAFSALSDPGAHEQLLGALGKFPFRQIEAKITQVLDDPNSPSSVRVAAVDALAGSSPEALPFLKLKAESDLDPRVREMAAWAISALPAEDGAMGPDLARMATAEPEVDVRRRLYEAMPTQAVNPVESLLPQIKNESDLAARVAGYNAVGDAVRRGTSGTLSGQFDTQMIPELTQIAVSGESVNIRMRAVFAIRRAGTPAAQAALQAITQTPNEKIAQAARHGLKPAK
jgi:HEAT repeat protein